MLSTAHRLTDRPRRGRARWRSRRASTRSCRGPSAFGAPLEAALDAGRVDDALLDATVARDPADEVPARAVRATVRRRRRPTRRSTRSPPTRRVAARHLARAVARPRRERRRPAARRASPAGRGHRADRRQRPRPARRLQPPRPHGDAARDARTASTRSGSSATARSSSRATSSPAAGRSSTRSAPRSVDARGPPRPRDRHPRRDRRGDRGGRRARPRVRRRDRRPRRALRADRRLDDRRVPRPARRSASSAASRSCSRRSSRRARRSCSWSSAAGRSRIEWAAGALRRGPARLGARRRRSGCDRRRADRGGEPGRQAAGLDPAPRRPGAVHVPPPPDGRPLAAEGRLRRRARVTPLWPFGYRPVVHDVPGRPAAGRPRRSSPRPTARSPISVDVTNTGDRAGDEVVQLYVRDDEATVARPVLELRGFRRVTLAAGRVPDRVVHGSRPSSSPTSAPTTGASSSPATITVHVGTSSVDLPLTATIRLVGPTIELRDRRRYLTETVLA